MSAVPAWIGLVALLGAVGLWIQALRRRLLLIGIPGMKVGSCASSADAYTFIAANAVLMRGNNSSPRRTPNSLPAYAIALLIVGLVLFLSEEEMTTRLIAFLTTVTAGFEAIRKQLAGFHPRFRRDEEILNELLQDFLHELPARFPARVPAEFLHEFLSSSCRVPVEFLSSSCRTNPIRDIICGQLMRGRVLCSASHRNLCALSLLLIAPAAAWSQVLYGSIVGNVRDAERRCGSGTLPSPSRAEKLIRFVVPLRMRRVGIAFRPFRAAPMK